MESKRDSSVLHCRCKESYVAIPCCWQMRVSTCYGPVLISKSGESRSHKVRVFLRIRVTTASRANTLYKVDIVQKMWSYCPMVTRQDVLLSSECTQPRTRGLRTRATSDLPQPAFLLQLSITLSRRSPRTIGDICDDFRRRYTSIHSTSW